MTAAITSVEALCNVALDRIGWPESIANIYEGTRQARIALRLYNEARDSMLRAADWNFPRHDVVLTLLKTAPAGGYVPGFATWDPVANPPRPYFYEYAYPVDCIMLRALKAPDIFQPNFAPLPQNYEIANDPVPLSGQSTAPGRVILCYLQNAIATYCGQILDMSQWDVGFVEAMIDRLAMGLAPALARAGQMELEGEKAKGAALAVGAAQALARVG